MQGREPVSTWSGDSEHAARDDDRVGRGPVVAGLAQILVHAFYPPSAVTLREHVNTRVTGSKFSHRCLSCKATRDR